MGIRLKKVILEPRKVVIPGTHRAIEMVSGFKRCSVDMSQGLMFHYKVKIRNIQVFSGIDTSIHRYSDQLSTALKHRWNILRTFNVTVDSSSAPN